MWVIDGVCHGCRLRVNLFYNPFVLTWLTIWGHGYETSFNE